HCSTVDVSQYFAVPRPTGALLGAFSSFYSASIEDSLTMTGNNPNDWVTPDSTAWCAFTTAAPESVLDEYTSHAGVVASWSAENVPAPTEVVQCIGWLAGLHDPELGASW